MMIVRLCSDNQAVHHMNIGQVSILVTPETTFEYSFYVINQEKIDLSLNTFYLVLIYDCNIFIVN